MYFAARHLQSKLQISADELRNFERKGIISSVTKNGTTFYSGRDVYRLKGILHFVRDKGLSVEQAVERIDLLAAVTSVASSGGR